jgi:hypothetical protein
MAMRSESLCDDFEIVVVVGDRAERSGKANRMAEEKA